MSYQMRLSPVDHPFTGQGGYPINFLLFFEGKIDPERVKGSLAEAVALFRPFGSRLSASLDGGRTLELKDHAHGYGFNFQKITSPPPMEDLNALTDFLKSAKSVPDEALLEVTLSHHASGSILGVSASHCLVDGFSYFLFLVAWSKIFQGQPPVTPQLDRTLLVPRTPLQGGVFDSARVFRDTGFAYTAEPRPGDSARVQWELHDYTKAQLDSLYSATASQSEIRLSLNDVLTAEIWKKFTRTHQRAGENLSLSCAFDYRRVLKDRISPVYFGNAIRGAAFEMEFEEVQRSSVLEIALRVNRAVKSIDEASALASLECLESLRLQEGLAAMEHFHVADPDRGFLVTNLSRLPLLELDFGTGAPVDFRILTPARRTAVVLPLKDGIRVQIAV